MISLGSASSVTSPRSSECVRQPPPGSPTQPGSQSTLLPGHSSTFTASWLYRAGAAFSRLPCRHSLQQHEDPVLWVPAPSRLLNAHAKGPQHACSPRVRSPHLSRRALMMFCCFRELGAAPSPPASAIVLRPAAPATQQCGPTVRLYNYLLNSAYFARACGLLRLHHHCTARPRIHGLFNILLRQVTVESCF